ncbi:2Fe-2S iron-sulfur cluster-binding protein [Methylobacterium sp. ID0610]|uniref:2Fe-2S iron-sulfur cluster-binding protein n=1 Tax=Methylobacterium carpenticola TaxID=3344827 RepID=UPI0036BF28DB
MPKIIYIEHGGRTHEVEVETGRTLMEGARQNNVPGILANCGGGCACSTCHVYVRVDWVSKLPPMDDMEAEMVDFAFARDMERSRLACQLRITDEMDGLVVELPERQA